MKTFTKMIAATRLLVIESNIKEASSILSKVAFIYSLFFLAPFYSRGSNCDIWNEKTTEVLNANPGLNTGAIIVHVNDNLLTDVRFSIDNGVTWTYNIVKDYSFTSLAAGAYTVQMHEDWIGTGNGGNVCHEAHVFYVSEQIATGDCGIWDYTTTILDHPTPGLSNGSITVTTNFNLFTDVRFRINGGPWKELTGIYVGTKFSGLSPGLYTIDMEEYDVIVGNVFCTESHQFALIEACNIPNECYVWKSTQVYNSEKGCNNGSITVNVDDNPFTVVKFSIDGHGNTNDIKSKYTFSGLTPGLHYIELRETNFFGGGLVCEQCKTYTVGSNEGFYTAYQDADGDGYGDINTPTTYTCPNVVPIGYVLDNTDCNDTSELVHIQTWYADFDNDSYGGSILTQCSDRPAGYKTAQELVDTLSDCDDNNSTVNPGTIEICNGIDDNCDNVIDERHLSITPSGTIDVCKNTPVLFTTYTDIIEPTYQWYHNGAPCPGHKTNSTYTAKEMGEDFYVVVSGKDCNGSNITMQSETTNINRLNNPHVNLQASNGNLNLCNGYVGLVTTYKGGYAYKWYKNDVSMNWQGYGQTIWEPGAYYVIVTKKNTGCKITSSTLIVTQPCKMEDKEVIADQIRIYPNPTSNNFALDLNLNSEGVETANIYLLNLLGQEIFIDKQDIVSGDLLREYTMPSIASSGWYIVRVVLSDQVIEQKLMYQK